MIKQVYWTLVVLLMAVICSPLKANETRSIWVLPWSLNSKTKIDHMIRQAVNNHQNELLVEVRYRSDALYTTNRVEDNYPNPEYRSYILGDADFDPLDYVINQAKAYHLGVQAWVVAFNATPTAEHLLADNYIYKNHRDWLTYENDRGIMKSTEAFGYFIDPGVPAAREHVKNVICDLASGYPDLDGIHLDYIRYPNTNFGYHPSSIFRYNLYKEQYPETSWNDWRILQVSSFVQDLRSELQKINPRLILSAAVFPVLSEARNQYAQDWKNWLEEGLIDRAYPMLYHTDDTAFVRILSDIESWGYHDKVVMGLRAWDAGGASLVPSESRRELSYNIFNVLDRIDWVRQREFGGIALFSYDGLMKGSGLSFLGQRAYRDSVANVIPPELASLAEAQDNPRESIQFAPNIYPISTYNDISIQVLIPEEGRWVLEIYDTDNRLLWKRDRYYLAGTNQDILNLSSTQNQAGDYYCHLYRETDNYKYIIPISFDQSWKR